MVLTLFEPLWLSIYWKVNGCIVIVLNSFATFIIFKYSSTEMAAYRYFLSNIL
ncbi:unnamed protein product, partial [Mesorhabditis spiculigera]